MEYLELALVLTIPIKLLVDLVKRITKEIPYLSEVNPYIYSILIGVGLGYFSSPTMDIYQRILVGLIAGAFPAPFIHDVLENLREVKNFLREVNFSIGNNQ